MSKVEQMEAELRKLSQAELRRIREWLDDMIEDELELTREFERSILEAERDMASGKSARVRGGRTEPWERARWTVKSVMVTDELRGTSESMEMRGSATHLRPAPFGLRRGKHKR